MRNLRFVLAAAAATVAAAAAVPAQAWSSWCDDEPPVTVVTPNGNHVTFNNFIGYNPVDRRLVRQIVVVGAAQPAGDGEALVTILVFTPEGGHDQLEVTSSSGRYETSAAAGAAWGTVTRLQVRIPDPPPPATQSSVDS